MSKRLETPAAQASSASDIKPDHWTLRLAPVAAQPYLRLARLDRPIGTWLLLLPCWWSLALASAVEERLPDWRLGLLFAVGALVMRGAGCTYNDIVDRNIDGRVARTASRPLPSGEVSLVQALAFLALQLFVGLLILLQLNPFSILLGAASLALVFTYPFMKRVTYWPQAFLGLTFNWGALIGWSSVTGDLDWPAILLYLGGIAWTLGYDTIYAHQDKEDDALIGVKSSALKLGDRSKPWLTVFYGLAVALFAAAGIAAGMGWIYATAIAAVATHFLWQVASLDVHDPANCLARFRANRDAGFILLLGMIAAPLFGA